MESCDRPWKTLAILATTQVISWGTLYYAFAIVAPDIAREFGWRAELVFGAFSWCLLVAGLAATPVGILLDRFGGRRVMGTGSLMCGAGFIVLSEAHGAAAYFLAWTILGVAMAQVLYEAAFATLNQQFGLAARQAISTVTLFGGFASTVFWPLTLALNTLVGWRATYLLYGVAQLALCLPLHMLLNGKPARPAAYAKAGAASGHFSLKEAVRHPAFWKLAFAFSANSFIFSGLSVHLIPILQRFGHSASTVVWMAALVGPMQVAGRIGEMAFARRATPQAVGRITFGVLPPALLAVLFFGQHQLAIALFCALYGLSNGILTIVRGTIPQALFGAKNYGAIAGAMAGPATVSRAAGPIAVAAVAQTSASPTPLFAMLLACSIVSLGFYLASLRSASPRDKAAQESASTPGG